MGRSPSARSKPVSPVNKPAFCEIFVEGYGNGLNEAIVAGKTKSDETITEPGAEADQSYESASPSALVSRESSKSSGYSRSSGTDEDADDLTEMDHLSVVSSNEATHTPAGNLKVMDVDNEMREIHFNTATWDALLGE